MEITDIFSEEEIKTFYETSTCSIGSGTSENTEARAINLELFTMVMTHAAMKGYKAGVVKSVEEVIKSLELEMVEAEKKS